MLANLRLRAPGLLKSHGFLTFGARAGDGAYIPADRAGTPPGRRLHQAASASLTWFCARAGRFSAFVGACARRDAERWELRRMDPQSQKDIGSWRIPDEWQKPWWRE